MTTTVEGLELVHSIEPAIQQLMDDHRSRREHWYAHEVVPWELGRSYKDEPWDESQATLSEPVRTAMALNLLTEDNLPYYHAQFSAFFDADSPMASWSRLWTAEEGQHSIAIRNYLLTSRNCDPRALEDDRLTTVERGWFGKIDNAVDIFTYTAAQELATRISHRNAGIKADCETAHEVMSRVAADENHHFMFYRGVVAAMLEQAPTEVLASISKVFNNFEMPGIGIPRFRRKAVEMARLGIYNLRIHGEQVVTPLLRYWQIASLEGLDARGAQLQEELMAMPPKILADAEVFEKRMERRRR